MAKNFGQKMMALQLGMIILGVLMFVGGYALKKSLSEKNRSQTVSVEGDVLADNKSATDGALQQ